MNPRSLHRGATREEQIRVEQARADGRAEGIETGIALAADFIEAMGLFEAAQALREAKIEQAEEGKAG